MPKVARGRASYLVRVAVASALMSFLFPLLQAQSPAATLVPAIITFGDSTMDVGNNNYIPALFKANFPPYGRNFTAHKPTGRFCDGKLVTDFTGKLAHLLRLVPFSSFGLMMKRVLCIWRGPAETLGFTSLPPAYLSPEASGKNLRLGASFASAGSGYYEETAAMYNALSLGKQAEYYKEYQSKLAAVVGENEAAAILAGAMHLLSTGNGDYVQNYYINSSLQRRYTRDEFSSLLVGNFARFVKDLYGSGARRIGVTSLPPLGCLPAPINLFGHGTGACIGRFNADAEAFNRALNATAHSLSRELPGLILVVLDVYQPLMELATSPSKHGFTEARKGCCRTGTSRTSVLCRPGQAGVCSNAERYVYWDGVHPSQAANLFISESVMVQGIALVP